MTQEQKAKAYDEVREKIALRFGSNVAEEIFSEFEESEDEKVRKRLIALCQHYIECYSFDQFNLDGYKEALAWLEKQGEKKPAWSEEDEEILNTIIADVNRTLRSCGIGTDEHIIRTKAIDFLKSLRFQNRWKPSKEQLKFLQHYADQNNYDGTVLTSLLNDLKKL